MTDLLPVRRDCADGAPEGMFVVTSIQGRREFPLVDPEFAARLSALRRHLPTAIVICLGIAISTAGFLAARAHFAREAEVRFQALAAERLLVLGNAIDRHLAILQSIKGLYAASSEVDRDEFHVFVELVESQFSGIQALEWIPRIPATARGAYEERAQADGYPEFRIRERNPDGDMVPATAREEYFPVYFLEPYQGNSRALGFDLASSPVRLEALNSARDTGQFSATASIRLVQETGSQTGFLAFAPIYRSGVTPETAERRRTELTGFALGVFRIGDIIASALKQDVAPAAMDIYMFDESAEAGQRFLHFQPSALRRHPAGRESAGPIPEDQLHEGLVFVGSHTVGDRHWSFVFKPTPGFSDGAEFLMPLGVAAVGLLLMSLLAQHLNSSSNRTEQVKQLVAERTADLMTANNQLKMEIVERSRVETDLSRSNAELEQFASVASHDLQEPLRKVQAFSDRLQRNYAEKLDDKGRDYLSRMGEATARMQTLINDLLLFSRVKTEGQHFARTDLEIVIQEVLSDLGVPIREAGAQVVIGAMPAIAADPVQIRQLFQNLVSNALKYRREDVPPIVRIEADIVTADPEKQRRIDGPVCRIRVSDNGIGFEPHYSERIFGIFQRLHGRAAYEGSGIGLAVCRRIAERHGGSIIAEGRPGEGATFTIDLPERIVQPGAHAK